MKKHAKIMFLSLLIVCLMIFSFTACGSENTSQQENVSETSQTENAKAPKNAASAILGASLGENQQLSVGM